MDDHSTPTKVCTKCGETKPLDNFPKKKGTKDGRKAYCNVCNVAAARAWAAANAERVRANKAAWHETNRDLNAARSKTYREQNGERYAAQRTAAYHANPEPAKRRAREWNAANPERAREKRRQYKRDNPATFIEANRRRRARKRGAVLGILSAEQWAAILNYFGHACGYCGVTGETLTQDHLMPLARGGEHTASNVIPSCGLCNRRKFYKPLWRFLLDESQRHE